MRGMLLAYCAGILLATLLTRPLLVLCWSGAGSAMLGLYLGYGGKGKLACCSHHCRHYCQLLLAVALGISWHMLWALLLLQARLPAELEGRNMWVSGMVTSLPTRTATATQFQFYIDDSDLGFSNRHVLLNYYSDVTVAAGQRWQLLIRLNRPRGFANPGGFDYEAWLFQQGISAKGYVREHVDNQLLGENSQSLQALRDSLRISLLEIAGELPNIGILLALSLGDRSQMRSADWDLMSASGTNHLFVISGLHIGLIAAATYWLCNWCLRGWPTLSLYCPRQKVAAWFALLMALGYSLLAGFTLPTQRAFVMTAVFVLGQIGARPVPVSIRFLLALALVLSLNPLAALNAGFWLSFVAVAALCLCLQRQGIAQQHERTTDKILTEWITPQLVVFLALAPFLLLWVQQLALLSPVINIFAIPLVGMIIVPLTLFGVCLLFVSDAASFYVLAAADVMLELLFAAIEWITAHARWSVLEWHALPYAVLLCLGVAMILLLLPVPRTLRLLLVPLFLPVLYPEQRLIADGALHLHILDVGQGLSVIAQTANHTLVYDTGAQLSPEFDLGSAVVVPVLRQLGINKVDVVVISHFDNDHAGGLAGLLGSVQTNWLFSSDPLRAQTALMPNFVASPRISASTCRAGVRWEWDDVEFDFLHPLAPGADANDFSCVLRIRSGELAVLLPGDIERAGELALVLRQRENLRSDILLAPHHGSNTSSTYAFIKAVAPNTVVFAAGYRNSFGHPTARIRQRYADLGAASYVTHDTGMLSFELEPDKALPAPMLFRQRHQRYWH